MSDEALLELFKAQPAASAAVVCVAMICIAWVITSLLKLK